MADQKVERDLPAELHSYFYHPDGENGYVTPRGGPVRLFGLPYGSTPNRLFGKG